MNRAESSVTLVKFYFVLFLRDLNMDGALA